MENTGFQSQLPQRFDSGMQKPDCHEFSDGTLFFPLICHLKGAVGAHLVKGKVLMLQ